MVSLQAPRDPSPAILSDDLWPDEKPFTAIWVLLLGQAGALVTQALAVWTAREGALHAGILFNVSGFGLAFASALWSLTRPQLTRALRNTAVVCLGATTTVLWWLQDPLLFRLFDEQLHMRTLNDILSSHRLFQANPQLGVSPRYPGLESVAALFHQLGLPVMVAAMAVVLVARLALVVVLCDAVEHVTGSPRAGGLAVAVYAVSAQFVVFNSMFAYQTLALPLALAAISFIARARWAADPRPLFGGATVCLLAAAVTHHVTSWLTAAFLVLWATAEGGRQARRRVFYGAVIAATATTLWATIQWSLLREYFGPMMDDSRTQLFNHERRQGGAFHDAAGDSTPVWERVFLVYWAAAVTLVVSLLIFLYVRSVLPRLRSGGPRCDARRWETRMLLVVLAALTPSLFAARVLPTGGEYFDRMSTFLFLPLSLLIAGAIDRWLQLRRNSNTQSWSNRQLVIGRSLAMMLATGVFVGGYLMGSGPDHMRLPGPYLVCADGRSMDAETLAAARWARDGLLAGGRIGADRVSSVLLASQAGLYPVMHEGDLEVAWLYKAKKWGRAESELARGLHLRYLYVDRRLADELPHTGSYFYGHDRGGAQQLTRAELTKFDNVPGIHTVYRHGPISIYDLSGLHVTEFRSGWVGKTPAIDVRIQLAIGILSGLALALVARSNAGYIVTEKVKSFKITAGPSLTFAAGLATLCAASVMLPLAHIWLGPIVFVSMALAALLVNPRWARFPFGAMFLLMNAAARLRWRKWIAALGILAVPVVVAIAQSILSAYPEDVSSVRSILDDPSAVHMPVHNLNPAGSADETR
jgi:hypothetical protein